MFFLAPSFASVPQQPQQEATYIVKASGEGRKTYKKGPKDKAPQATPTPPKPPKPSTPCALCDVVGHATNNFPELSHIKSVVSDTFPESNNPKVHVTLPESAHIKESLRTNHPCDLCDIYDHYSHHYPSLEYFRNTLQVIHELDVARSDSTSPLPTSFGPTAFQSPPL